MFVFAAENYGCNSDETPFYPASHPLNNIISVTTSNRSDEFISWSNYGANTVHIVAPGEEILRYDLKIISMNIDLELLWPPFYHRSCSLINSIPLAKPSHFQVIERSNTEVELTWLMSLLLKKDILLKK